MPITLKNISNLEGKIDDKDSESPENVKIFFSRILDYNDEFII